jgi:hypothetical protein
MVKYFYNLNISMVRSSLTGFESNNQKIKGTNDQLMKQFPELLKEYKDMLYRVMEEANATAGNVTFIDCVGTNQSPVVIPYINVTEQTYTDEFKSLIGEMDKTGKTSASSCWEAIVKPPETIGTWKLDWIHATACWGPSKTG